MQKAYSRINWENYPSTETPLNETNLNRIDLALDTVDNRVVTFDLSKANQTDLLTCVDGITFNTSSGILTISFKNGTTATIDTGLAKLAVNFDYDEDPTSPHYQQLILEMKDGTYKYIDLSSMITQFEFDNTSTVVFNVDAQTGHISAVVPDGSITANKLDPNVVVTMQAIEDAAKADALKSEGLAVGEQNGVPVGPGSPYYENNAKYYCEQAQGGGSGGHVIKDDTQTFVQRTGLKFSGKVAVTDDAVGGNTVVTVEAGGAVPHLIVLSEAGSTVRVVKGTKTIYATETSAEHFECDLEMDDPQDIYGVWTIHAVLDGDDATMSLNVDTIKVYTVDDSHMHADITVTYPNGATVSCSMTGAPTQYATSSPYTFVVHSYGVWRITGTRGGVTEIHDVTIYENGQEEEVTLSLIPDGSTVTPTDDIQLWLACAGIEDKPYTMLQQVLADSATLLKVLTNDNASDYLARSTTWATGITADSNAMTIIGSYDYCANALLESGSTWAMAIVGSAYANSVENISTPIMTSDNTPSGQCSAKTTYSSTYSAWKAFDKDASTMWASVVNSTDDYLRYKFAKAQKINAVKVKALYSGSLRLKTLSIKASNDSFSTSATLMETITLTNQNVEDYVYLVNPTIPYESYGIENLSTYQSDIEIKELDFLGRENGGAQSWLKAGGIQKSYTQLSQILGDTATLRDLMASNDAVDYLVTAKAFIDDICANQTAMSLIGANDYAADTLLADSEWNTALFSSTYKNAIYNLKNPTMTSDTTPEGQCGASYVHSTFAAYKAFDGDTNGTGQNVWSPAARANEKVWYRFTKQQKIYHIVFYPIKSTNYNASSKEWDIISSNDGSIWNTEASGENPNSLGGVPLAISNPTLSDYWGVLVKTSYRTDSWGCTELELYGRETGGVQTWLHSAGITNKNYTTVAEVLADTTTLLTLMTNDDAIDYLVTAKTFINDICADENAIKFINSYDYCANTLLADEDWSVGICNSTYASEIIVASTPDMTSETTPWGEAIASTSLFSSGYGPSRAFDKATASGWQASAAAIGQWIGFDFKAPIFVKKVTERDYGSTYGRSKIQIIASDDGINWDVISSNNVTGGSDNTINIFDNTVSKRFWAVKDNVGGSNNWEVHELDFYGRINGGVQSWLHAGGITDKNYTTLTELLADSTTLTALLSSADAYDYLVTAKGLINGICANSTAMGLIGLDNYGARLLTEDEAWCGGISDSAYAESVLNAKTPIMTSANTPSGEASAGSSFAASTQPWNAFDWSDAHYWCANHIISAGQTGTDWLMYKFDAPVKVRAFFLKDYYGTSSIYLSSIQVLVSNDGTNWETVFSSTPASEINDKICNLCKVDDAYTYYKFNISAYYRTSVGSNAGLPSIKQAGFYWREDV